MRKAVRDAVRYHRKNINRSPSQDVIQNASKLSSSSTSSGHASGGSSGGTSSGGTSSEIRLGERDLTRAKSLSPLRSAGQTDQGLDQLTSGSSGTSMSISNNRSSSGSSMSISIDRSSSNESNALGTVLYCMYRMYS